MYVVQRFAEKDWKKYTAGHKELSLTTKDIEKMENNLTLV